MLTLKYTTKAQKSLDKLDRAVKKKIEDYMNDLCTLQNPRAKGKGLTGNRAGQWRYRVGDYRVICEIQDSVLIILVLEIGHRSEIYKK